MNNLLLLNDQPINEGPMQDGLGFDVYATVLSQVAIDTPGPFTVGVFGEWGTGKTSLLRMIKNKLDGTGDVLTIWFNAWRYESEEKPIVPLVATIIREIEQNQTFRNKIGDGITDILNSLRAVAYGFSVHGKINLGAVEIGADFKGKEAIDRKQELDVTPLLDRSLYYEAFQSLAKSTDSLPSSVRIVVIIDDLDRCLPDNGIKLLESIKLVLAQPGFIFFLGVSRSVLEEYLKHRYQTDFGIESIDGKSYLDKIVQLPFHIPPHHARMDALWEKITQRVAKEDREEFEELRPIVDVAVASNPRSAIRFVNILLVDRAIYDAISEHLLIAEKLPIHFFALSRSIQQRWPGFYLFVASSTDAQCDQIAVYVNEGDSNVFTDDKKEPLKTLYGNQELIRLLKSGFGKQWLGQHGKRTATIDFLRRERPIEGSVPVIGVYFDKYKQDIEYYKKIRQVIDELHLEIKPISGDEDLKVVNRFVYVGTDPSDIIIQTFKDAIKKNVKPVLIVKEGDFSTRAAEFFKKEHIPVIQTNNPINAAAEIKGLPIF